MPATITLTGENDTGAAFDAVSDDLDRLEREANQAGRSLEDFNAELDARKANRYSDAVSEIGSQESRITAVSTAFLGAAEGLEAVAEAAEFAYETVSRWSDAGYGGATSLKKAIDGLGGSLDMLARKTLFGGSGRGFIGGELEHSFRQLQDMVQFVSGTTDAEEVAAQRAAMAERILDKFAAKKEQAALAKSIGGIDSLARVKSEIAQIKSEFQQTTDTSSDWQQTLLKMPKAANKWNLLIERRQELEQAAHDQRMTNIEAERQARKDAAKQYEKMMESRLVRSREELGRFRDALGVGYGGDVQNAQSARVNSHEERMAMMELKGDEADMHEARMKWIKEEWDRRIAAADSLREEMRLRMEQESKLQEEIHNERMRQIEQAAAKKREIEEKAAAYEEKRERALEARTKGYLEGWGPGRVHAVQQVFRARVLKDKQEFLASDEAQGMTGAERSTALWYRRAKIGQTTLRQARTNQLSTKELGKAQEFLAEHATRQARAAGKFGQVTLDAVTANLKTADELIDAQKAMTSRMAEIRDAAKSQQRRVRAIQGALN